MRPLTLRSKQFHAQGQTRVSLPRAALTLDGFRAHFPAVCDMLRTRKHRGTTKRSHRRALAVFLELTVFCLARASSQAALEETGRVTLAETSRARTHSFWSKCNIESSKGCLRKRDGVRGSGFVFPELLLDAPRQESSNSGCVDARSYGLIIDLSCSYTTPHSRGRVPVYHRVAQCVLPSAPLAEFAEKQLLRSSAHAPLVLVQEQLAPLFSALFMLNHSSVHVLPPRVAGRPAPCFIVQSGSTLLWERRDLQQALSHDSGRAKIRARAVPVLRRRAAALRSAAARAPPDTILIVQRTGSVRSFCNFTENLLPRLETALQPSGLERVRVYHGNESIVDTLAMFASAKLVIAFHGAAIVNVFFSPPSANVVEITFWNNQKKSRGPYDTNTYKRFVCSAAGLRCAVVCIAPTAESGVQSRLAFVRHEQEKRIHDLLHATPCVRLSDAAVAAVALAAGRGDGDESNAVAGMVCVQRPAT